MSQKRIFSVGYLFPGGEGEQIDYESDRSLLDADIVVFEPSLGEYTLHGDPYQGKPSLSDYSSFAVRERAAHWRAEITDAVEAGKTVVVFLARPEMVYVDTGQRQHSGTGKNRQTTRLVTKFSSFQSIPLVLDVQQRSGKEIVAAGDLKYLAPYWKAFASLSPYEATISGTFSETLLQTKAGDRVIGALARVGRGAIVLLPPLRYDEEEFTIHGQADDPDTWTAKAVRFGKQLASALVEIDKALRSATDETPAPEWSQDARYRMGVEAEIEGKIQKQTKSIAEMQEQRRGMERSLREAGRLRGLLFERGKPLEASVLEALRILGFTAEPVVDGESAFDAVFISEEGRFLGEVEGKDNRAINIDKLSQLERNLHEDFERDDVDDYAHGVLFGNAFRLSPVDSRGDFFTQKCVAGAVRGGLALVRTPDMFGPTRYLKETNDPDYARSCRKAIAEARGAIVQFPNLPRQAEKQRTDEKA